MTGDFCRWAGLTILAVAACVLPRAAVGQDSDGAGPWYVYFGNNNSHPRLHIAAKSIDQQINQPFRLVAPGFSDVATFLDQRRDLKIWSPFIGVGRLLNDKWDVYIQGGYSAGKTVTRATDPSLILLPLHTNVEIQRANAFVGVGVAWFPQGVVDLECEHDGITSRIKGSRPYLVSVLQYNYLSFEADVRAGLVPFGTLFRHEEKDHWNIMSLAVGAGVDTPLTEHLVGSINVQYNHFFELADDFSGPSVNLLMKYFF